MERFLGRVDSRDRKGRMPSAVFAGGRSSNAGAALHGERHCKASRPQEVAAS